MVHAISYKYFLSKGGPMNGHELMQLVKTKEYEEEFAHLNWSGSFADYLDLVIEKPEIARSAIQRIYDMVMSYGYSTYKEYKKEIRHYNFFDDPMENGRDAIFGLDVHMQKLVNVLKAGSMRYGPEKRVLLLHGPVGSSKSTIARLVKKGLEKYTRQPEGALFTYTWTTLGDILEMED
jgi:serine protein kinase